MLDNISQIDNIDKFGMRGSLTGFPEQIENAIEIGRNAKIPKFEFGNIVIAGMGGSAIGGDILAAVLKNTCTLPVFVNRDYALPGFASKDTLLIVSSYSGNTEETISAFQDGIDRGCNIIVVTSGGKLKQLATMHSKPIIQIPAGFVPRAALNYLLFPVITVLEQYGLVMFDVDDVLATIRDINARISPENRTEENTAKQIALKVTRKTPIIYGHTYYVPIARRWKTQFNENAKIAAFFSSFPEMCHNDLVALANDKNMSKFMHILLRDKEEHTKLKKRIEVTKELVFKDCIEVYASGKTQLAKMLSLLYIGDFASYYLAILKGIDPTPVEVIERLKKKLEQ